MDENCNPSEGTVLKCSDSKQEAVSEKYELCEHSRNGCDLDEINAKTYYDTLFMEYSTTNQTLNLNDATPISPLANSDLFSSLQISSQSVCSYEFYYEKEGFENSNVFEIRLKELKNVLIGLYFNSTIFDETVDYLVFYPE